MGFFTDFAKGFIDGYVEERGVDGAIEDAGDLISSLFGKKND